MRSRVIAALFFTLICASAPVPTAAAVLTAAMQDSATTSPLAPAQRPAEVSDALADPAQAARARAINMKLRCPVCSSSSIEESPAFQAEEMKAVVRQQIAAGRSDAEIEKYFVTKYGEWILLAPPAHGINLLVYVLPLAVVIGGGFFVYRTARRWTQA